MQPPDWLAARLRTVWPMLLGYLAARLLDIGAPASAWAATVLGVPVTQPMVEGALALVLGYVMYEVGRLLESRTGDGRLATLARAVGKLVLSLGLHTGQPTYGLPPARTTSEYEYDNTGGLRTARTVTTWPPRGGTHTP